MWPFFHRHGISSLCRFQSRLRSPLSAFEMEPRQASFLIITLIYSDGGRGQTLIGLGKKSRSRSAGFGTQGKLMGARFFIDVLRKSDLVAKQMGVNRSEFTNILNMCFFSEQNLLIYFTLQQESFHFKLVSCSCWSQRGPPPTVRQESLIWPGSLIRKRKPPPTDALSCSLHWGQTLVTWQWE